MAHNSVPVILEIIITIVTAAGVILQLVALVATGLTIKAASDRFNEGTKKIKEHGGPAVATARVLFTDLFPKVKFTAANCTEACGTLQKSGARIVACGNSVAVPLSRLLKMRSATASPATRASTARTVVEFAPRHPLSKSSPDPGAVPKAS